MHESFDLHPKGIEGVAVVVVKSSIYVGPHTITGSVQD